MSNKFKVKTLITHQKLVSTCVVESFRLWKFGANISILECFQRKMKVSSLSTKNSCAGICFFSMTYQIFFQLQMTLFAGWSPGQFLIVCLGIWHANKVECVRLNLVTFHCQRKKKTKFKSIVSEIFNIRFSITELS